MFVGVVLGVRVAVVLSLPLLKPLPVADDERHRVGDDERVASEGVGGCDGSEEVDAAEEMLPAIEGVCNASLGELTLEVVGELLLEGETVPTVETEEVDDALAMDAVAAADTDP